MNNSYMTLAYPIVADNATYWQVLEFYHNVVVDTISYNGEDYQYDNFVKALEIIINTMTTLVPTVPAIAVNWDSDTVDDIVETLCEDIAISINDYAEMYREDLFCEEYAEEINFIVYENDYWHDNIHTELRQAFAGITESQLEHITENITEFCDVILGGIYVPYNRVIVDSYSFGEQEVEFEQYPLNAYGIDFVDNAKSLDVYLETANYCNGVMGYINMEYDVLYWALNFDTVEEYLQDTQE